MKRAKLIRFSEHSPVLSNFKKANTGILPWHGIVSLLFIIIAGKQLQWGSKRDQVCRWKLSCCYDVSWMSKDSIFAVRRLFFCFVYKYIAHEYLKPTIVSVCVLIRARAHSCSATECDVTFWAVSRWRHTNVCTNTYYASSECQIVPGEDRL